MRPTPYAIGQALFLLAFAALFDRMTDLMILGLAAIQLVLVAGRLWDAGQKPWLALAPPALTVAVWLIGMSWATGGDGGDGDGLMAALAAAVACLVSYVAVGASAACLASRRTGVKAPRHSAHAWAPPWQARHP
jgi:hypothetical protein